MISGKIKYDFNSNDDLRRFGGVNMYIRRHLEEQILKASQSYPVVMVCGQRQVGKSTMLYHIREKERKYVTLDDGNARRLAEEDPALFSKLMGFLFSLMNFREFPPFFWK